MFFHFTEPDYDFRRLNYGRNNQWKLVLFELKNPAGFVIQTKHVLKITSILLNSELRFEVHRRKNCSTGKTVFNVRIKALFGCKADDWEDGGFNIDNVTTQLCLTDSQSRLIANSRLTIQDIANDRVGNIYIS